MASYNEDAFDRALSYWNENAEEEWQKYQTHFATLNKDARVGALISADNRMGGDLRPNHETASWWAKRRILEAIHRKLDSMGRLGDVSRCNRQSTFTQ